MFLAYLLIIAALAFVVWVVIEHEINRLVTDLEKLKVYAAKSKMLSIEIEALSRMVAKQQISDYEIHEQLVKAALYAGNYPRDLASLEFCKTKPNEWYRTGNQMLKPIRKKLRIYS